MLATREAVACHVAPRPVQARTREVDGGGVLGPAVRCVAGRGARVGKEVEEALGPLGQLHHLADAPARLAVVEEDAAVVAGVEVDLEGEAALVHQVRARGQLHAAALVRGTVGPTAALGRARLVGVLRPATRPGAHAHAHVARRHAHHARRDGEHVQQATVRELEVHAARGRVLGDLQPASRGLRALVELDRHGVVRQVGIVDPVASHVLAPGPLGAELRHLGEAARKLLGAGHEHGHALRGDVDAGRRLHVIATRVAADGRRVAAHDDLRGGVRRDAQRGVEGGPASEGDDRQARDRGRRRERGGLARERRLADPGEVAGHKGGRGGAGGVGRLGGGEKRRLHGHARSAKSLAARGGRAGPVVADDERARVPLARRGTVVGLVEKRLPGGIVVLGPARKAPASAQKPRRAIERGTGGLHEHAALSRPERHEGRRAGADGLSPAAGREQGRRVVGAQRRHALRGARVVAAPEERLTGQVNGERGVVAREARVDREGRARRVRDRPGARGGEDAVHDRVLHAQSHELRVSELGVGTVSVHGKGRAGREVLLPGDGARALVERIGVAGVHAREDGQYARSQARPQADAVGVRELATKAHLALERAHLGHAQVGELVGQQPLKALGARRNKLHRVTSRPSRTRLRGCAALTSSLSCTKTLLVMNWLHRFRKIAARDECF